MRGRFLTSASSANGMPDFGMPEIAFAGRSNVGKSSLLGEILRKPKLVRTSRTPGRTQLLNVFSLDDELALVDLPGYGYAKLSKKQRACLDIMVTGYLKERVGLLGVVQLLDARRERVSEADRAIAEMVVGSSRRLLLVITKSDLIPKNQRIQQSRRIEKDLGVPVRTAILCSARTGEGRDELVRAMRELAAI